MRVLSAAAVAALLLAPFAFGPAACSNQVCEAPPDEALVAVPARLSETGLYASIAEDRFSPSVSAYAPRFTLWSDGAEKRRWVFLPPGARIDTREMDRWQFPRGTRFFKEFTRDGMRVETRMLLKFGDAPSEWASMAYLWRADGSDADAVPDGVIDARGTPHDVPAAGECFACHGGTTSRILGFGAIQLSHVADGTLDLRTLVARGLLTDPPAADFVVPGNETEREALGYLHANCGHCHNQNRPTDDGRRCFDPKNQLDFLLRVDRLARVEDTPAYASAIGFDVSPGDPDGSGMIDKVSHRPGMPPLATERVDEHAVSILRAWIAGMR